MVWILGMNVKSFIDISRALQQFVLECMILTTVDEHGRICRPQTDQKDIPWDDPYPYYMGMIPDTDERVKSGCVERPDSGIHPLLAFIFGALN